MPLDRVSTKVISIHAGKKTNGLDKEISNALPVNQAVKSDYAEHVDFFEVGRLKDIEEYKENVFKEIGERPIVICSDNHDPRAYSTKENLWIKADLTFEGLKQCIHQPDERVFVGLIPPMLDRADKNAKATICNIMVRQVGAAKHPSTKWFDFSLGLNPGLVAIIGNKGSGKSALSDIIGHLCKCKTMSSASFLNKSRFRKPPKNYASDYDATITWADKHTETMSLGMEKYSTTIEDAQYLPQKFIEEVCNDIGEEFQREIDNVIFSYVNPVERGNAVTLSELVSTKSKVIELGIQKIQGELEELNSCIIQLENKKTLAYKMSIKDGLAKLEERLSRHEKSKPHEVSQPDVSNEDNEYQESLDQINQQICSVEEKISSSQEELKRINIAVNDVEQLIARGDILSESVITYNTQLSEFLARNPCDISVDLATVSWPKACLESLRSSMTEEKNRLFSKLGDQSEGTGYYGELHNANVTRDKLISTADSEEKKYQKYLADLREWETERKKIIGTRTEEGTLEYFRAENKYLDENLETEYSLSRNSRNNKVRELFALKQRVVEIYRQIYAPVEEEIKTLLGDIEDSIEFSAELQLSQNELGSNILNLINQKYAGVFKGKAEAHSTMESMIRKTEFDNIEGIIGFIQEVMVAVDEDIDNSSKKIADKMELYRLLYNLEYVGTSYKLKMGGRSLEELSPGERGIVLLVFYLALSQNNTPIIIDQPEDNLDNQSVYNKLVPCICAAKKKRQVIIVTHNPNIAIACDAEQIIYCSMDKALPAINYCAGSIENPTIRGRVVDVLEGTMPAFALRQKKYKD